MQQLYLISSVPQRKIIRIHHTNEIYIFLLLLLLVTYPLDVVRRQMQTAGYSEGHNTYHKNTLTALQTIIKQEGIAGLYRGLSINYIRAAPQVAISFTTYEWVKKKLARI